MPELPEVETVRRGLEKYLPGSTVRRVTLKRPDLRWPIPVRAVRNLAGRRLVRIDRRSKYLLLHFDGPREPVAMIHLGMSGRLFTDAGEPDEWRRHEHWRMEFDRVVLRFVDPRRFGMLDVTPAADLERHKLLADLGPEPLGDSFDGGILFQRTRRRRVAVKTYLMNAKEVVGVGNIYASEACFRAGVRPGRGIHRTTRAECDRLASSVRDVLSEAIAAGGTTLRDYVGVDEDTGYFQRSLSVYGRDGEDCDRCGGTIKRIVQTARSTYYCPGCQV